MPFACPHCQKQFPLFNQLRGHVLARHPGEGLGGLTADGCRVEGSTDQTPSFGQGMSDLEVEPEQIELHDDNRPTDIHPGDNREAAVRLSSKATLLFRLLTLSGEPKGSAERIACMVDEYQATDNPAMTLNILRNHVSNKGAQSNIPMVLTKLFPDSTIEGFSITTPEQRLQTLESKLLDVVVANLSNVAGNHKSEPDVWLLKYIEERDKRLEDREDRLLETITKLSDENRSLKDKLSESSGRSQDWECRVLDIVNDQIVPTLGKELAGIRADFKTLMQNVSLTGPDQVGMSGPGPITPEESERLASAMTLRQKIKELASKQQADVPPTGNSLRSWPKENLPLSSFE